MSSLENIINLDKLIQLQNFNHDNLENFPCHIFLKDRKGKYIDCNDTVVQAAGFNKYSDFLGLTDADLCWAGDSSPALINDHKVMMTGKPQLENMHFHDYCKNLITSICVKSPMKTKSKKIIGVIGFAFVQKIEPHEVDKILNQFYLTKRELTCLHYLVRGKTAKEISTILFISSRTVEKHLSNIKGKLNCKTKSELIDRAIAEGFNYNIS